MRRVHHVGITVSDIGSAVEFYRELTNGVVSGPFHRSGPAIDAVTGYPGVVVHQAFITAPDGETMIELLQYENGSPVVIDPDNGSVGAVHVAIVVHDLDATLVRLAARGVEALSAPITGGAGLMENHRFLYVLGPDRVRVELIEPPA
jgi:glyoxylase I family protein